MANVASVVPDLYVLKQQCPIPNGVHDRNKYVVDDPSKYRVVETATSSTCHGSISAIILDEHLHQVRSR